MKKKIISLSLLSILFTHLNAQTGNDFNKDVDNINKIFPAAPTSNNLMKFEEVPVSYYTGIPDINIPLFNIPTNNPNVNLNVQLKYHPLSAKPEDKASETGLGWSLLAGGTITRTVRGGVADELIESTFMSPHPSLKYGVYRHEYNPTYKMIYNISDFDIKEYGFYAGIGRYDTEYDLYQYNFMGYSGRFIILKDQNGNFHVEKLDRNNLRITSSHIGSGEVESITITDDKGIQYIFKGMESISKDISTVRTGLFTGSSDVSANIGGGHYFTAFHLDKVKDQNKNILLSFQYEQTSVVEYYDPESRTTRRPKNVVNDYEHYLGNTMDPDSQMPGLMEYQTIKNTADTKLLTGIAITDKGSIQLTYEKGRIDSNYLNPTNLYKLKSIQSNIIGQGINQYIDKYTFDYDYSSSFLNKSLNTSIELKKLLLKKISQSSAAIGDSNEYSIDYNNFNSSYDKDNWGYYKDGNQAGITQDIIKSITYPTKGKVIFDFNENVFSYAPTFESVMAPITGEWVEQSYDFSTSVPNTFNPDIKLEHFTIVSPQKVKLHLNLGSLIYSNWEFNIFKKTGANTFSAPIATFGMGWQSCISTGGAQCPTQNPGESVEPIREYNKETEVLEPGTYYVSLDGNYGITQRKPSYSLTANTKERIFKSYVTKNGGGLRINTIKYFDTPASTEVSKEFVYDYKDLDDPQKSSGALVFPEPLFKYIEFIKYFNYDTNSGSSLNYSCDSETTTDFNVLPVEKTQGSDVGYQYVTVRQIAHGNNNNIIDNGKTVYKFRSPIEFPNTEVFGPTMPIYPINNEDYLRGQMIFEKKYDTEGKLISEVNHEYSTLSLKKVEGIKIKDNYYNNINPDLYKYTDYYYFKKFIPGKVLTSPFKYYAKYGITLPTQKTETSYFYKNGVQSSVTNSSTSVYNALDYLSLSTQTLSDGTSTVTNYSYATEKNNQKLITANMIGIPLETGVIQKMTSSDPGKTIAKTELIYDPATSSLLPDAVTGLNIQTNVMENKIRYDRYDSKGNIQQYTTKDGISTVIIWGYGQTQAIAKIEGAKLTDISQSLIDSVVIASNTDAAAGANNDETALFTAFKTFRDSLPNYQITTYSYDPLIGVRSITPPSGIREQYIYDSAGRLEKVIDMDGKILKEMKYNYKN